MKIGEVAAQSGVPAKTIRFWEEQRLLPEPSRTAAGYRLYEASTIERLTFVRHAQAAGLALDQIRQVLDIGDSGAAPCQHVSDLIAGRLVDVDARIAELVATRDHLRVLAQRAAAQDPAECHGYCSILRSKPADSGRPGRLGARISRSRGAVADTSP
jgi:DNA-binding transcriptional MerR regulator